MGQTIIISGVFSLTTQRVEKKVADSLPNQFGIIIDGWKEGTTHYIAIFASLVGMKGIGDYPLLAIAPLFAETTFNMLKITKHSLEIFSNLTEKA